MFNNNPKRRTIMDLFDADASIFDQDYDNQLDWFNDDTQEIICENPSEYDSSDMEKWTDQEKIPF